MSVEIRVPAVGESITEVQVGDWLKAEGEAVALDEPVVVLETDKATVEVPSPVAGVLSAIRVARGQRANVGDVLALVEEGAAKAGAPAAGGKSDGKAGGKSGGKAAAPEAAAKAAVPEAAAKAAPDRVMPAARAEAARLGIPLEAATPTGPGGRLLKEDVQRAAREGAQAATAAAAGGQAAPVAATGPGAGKAPPVLAGAPAAPEASPVGDRTDEVVPMTMMRRRIAERLVQAQSQAALLTTFNEIDMGTFMDLRKRVQEEFTARHGIKLGLMAIFVKAVVDALGKVPQLNAEIRGDDIVYHRYFDVGIAVGGGRGLVVPVVRDADRKSLADIERAIADFGARAKANRIELHELQGGTFTISNGGVYGSLLSTPIVNPPQAGVLGLHAIQDRPVARDGEVVIRPMMYVALTYDHRLVDGREAVTFLKRVKEVLEDPARLVLDA